MFDSLPSEDSSLSHLDPISKVDHYVNKVSQTIDNCCYLMCIRK